MYREAEQFPLPILRTITPKTALSDRPVSPLSALLKDYPGAKNGSGVAQAIINQMPPHDTYIEPFLGSGAVLRRKRPARSSIAIDADGAVVAAWANHQMPGLSVAQGDAVAFLKAFPWTGKEVVYVDPPYLMSTRSSQRRYYRHEFSSPLQHMDLIECLRDVRARVILSGYPSELYKTFLADWRMVTFQTVTHGGRKVTECLWMNFPEPFELHDYRFLGTNFRERARIKKRKDRWKARLAKMTPLERGAVLSAIAELQTHSPAVATITKKGDRIPHVSV